MVQYIDLHFGSSTSSGYHDSGIDYNEIIQPNSQLINQLTERLVETGLIVNIILSSSAVQFMKSIVASGSVNVNNPRTS